MKWLRAMRSQVHIPVETKTLGDSSYLCYHWWTELPGSVEMGGVKYLVELVEVSNWLGHHGLKNTDSLSSSHKSMQP